jgi:hypothetical protein
MTKQEEVKISMLASVKCLIDLTEGMEDKTKVIKMLFHLNSIRKELDKIR